MDAGPLGGRSAHPLPWRSGGRSINPLAKRPDDVLDLVSSFCRMTGLASLLPKDRLDVWHGQANVPQIDAQLEESLIACMGRRASPLGNSVFLTFAPMIMQLCDLLFAQQFTSAT
jgi:hypothetical protein